MKSLCGVALVFALLAVVGDGAQALNVRSEREFGTGEAPRVSELFGKEFRDLLDDARSPPLGEAGPDAIRFSSQPALGGSGYVISISPEHGVEIAWFYGHSRLGWRRIRDAHFKVSSEDYRYLANEVDRLLADGVAEAVRRAAAEDETFVVCGDGPGYLTERRRDGETLWYRPGCGGANTEIARFLSSWILAELGR